MTRIGRLFPICLLACGDAIPIDTADLDSAIQSGPVELCEGLPKLPNLSIDCDANGVADEDSISADPSLDRNQDGLLDSCQSPASEVLFGRENYVSYEAGDLPIVLLAPHGGQLIPDEIPERSSSPPSDSHTYELAEALANALEVETGLRPHLVACHLHRSRLDCNRSLSVGAEGNIYAEQAWKEFHAFIEQAKASAIAVYGQALVLDLHGMSRDRIEIGTLIDGSQWLVGDSRLDHDAYAASSSIRQLAQQSGRSFSSISRGPLSLGAELESHGYAVVPSPGYPDPGTDSEGSALDYYEGGYNTAHHGSRHGGLSDAIQLEHPLVLRVTKEVREAYAADLAESVVSFFEEMSGIALAHPTGLRLIALGPMLSETGEPGLLRAIRTGDASEALTIPLRSSGEALASSDLNLPESVEFPAGEQVVDLPLHAIDDDLVEGPEAFSLRVEDGLPIQILGEPASFWIADNESPALWFEERASTPTEGAPFSLLAARDFCESAETLELEVSGEVEAADFENELESIIHWEAGESTLSIPIPASADQITEGAEELVIEGALSTNPSHLIRWEGWLYDNDLSSDLNAWWDLSHPVLPELDRVAQTPLIFLPLDSPPLVEANPSSTPAHWLALDGQEDVAVLEAFFADSVGEWWIEFQFRARPESTNEFNYLWSHGSVGSRSSLNIYLTSEGTLRTGFRGEEDDWSYTLLDVEAQLLDGEWHSYRLEIDWETPEARVFLDNEQRATGALGTGGYDRVDHVYLGARSDLRDSRHFWGDLAGIQLVHKKSVSE